MSKDSGGKGGTTNPLQTPPPTSHPDQSSLTYAAALGGAAGGSNIIRKYEEIIAQQKTKRNVLEIKIRKNIPHGSNADNRINQPRSLTIDDLSELVFEVLEVKFEECIGVDFYTGRYDTREIVLKPEVDPAKYITSEPIDFKDHEIVIKKMLNDVTKVTFKNVPMYVPDEEILHLCGIYGTVQDNKVYWEKQRVTTSTKKGILLSPTRYVLMNLNNGSSFNNYYWMEGPMAGDPGRRVTVLHHGQKQQCSHCFLTASTGCKGAGNGRACMAANGERAIMSVYMNALKMTTGYESLKAKYMRQLSRQGLHAEPNPLNTTVVAGDDVSVDDDIDHDEEREVTIGIIPINPIIEKDIEIANLSKRVEELQAKVATTEQGLEEAKHENKRLTSISRQVGRRLSVSRQANEQKMISLIKTGSNWTEDSAHLACCLAASINDDEFELDDTEDTVKPKSSNFNFLKKVEENVDLDEKVQVERLEEIKRMILEKIKKTIKKKLETRGEKRVSETPTNENLQSKPRVVSPIKM